MNVKQMNSDRPDEELVAAALATRYTIRKGEKWATKCPFHFSMDNNSLLWDPKTGEYQCFVCEKRGVAS